MANGRQGRKRTNTDRDPGGFVALPWSVLDSSAYRGLGPPAKALLMEIARQFTGGNNGCMRASGAYLKPRGWSSNDVITRALKELINAKLIHQTVMGHRPNKASWYAVTWLRLDRNPKFDYGAFETFQRGEYRDLVLQKSNLLTPSHGAGRPSIAPSHGAEQSTATPSHGAMPAVSMASLTPSDGDHLEKPFSAKHSAPMPAHGSHQSATPH